MWTVDRSPISLNPFLLASVAPVPKAISIRSAVAVQFTQESDKISEVSDVPRSFEGHYWPDLVLCEGTMIKCVSTLCTPPVLFDSSSPIACL